MGVDMKNGVTLTRYLGVVDVLIAIDDCTQDAARVCCVLVVFGRRRA